MPEGSLSDGKMSLLSFVNYLKEIKFTIASASQRAQSKIAHQWRRKGHNCITYINKETYYHRKQTTMTPSDTFGAFK